MDQAAAGILAVALLFGLGLVPSITATVRRHRQAGPIVIINFAAFAVLWFSIPIAAGMWLVAFAWSASSNVRPPPSRVIVDREWRQ